VDNADITSIVLCSARRKPSSRKWITKYIKEMFSSKFTRHTDQVTPKEIAPRENRLISTWIVTLTSDASLTDISKDEEQLSLQLLCHCVRVFNWQLKSFRFYETDTSKKTETSADIR